MLSVILLLSLVAQPLAPQNFFAIVGSITDDEGHAVSSVRVSLEDENSQPLQTAFADSSGRFKFRGLRAGDYVVRVEPTGLPYEPVAIKVPLQSITNSSINQSTTEEHYTARHYASEKEDSQQDCGCSIRASNSTASSGRI